MEANNDIRTIFRRYLDGQYTKEDVDALVRYFDLEEPTENLTLLIQNELRQDIPDAADHERIHRIKQRVEKRLDQTVRPSRRIGYTVIKVAALFLAIASVTYMAYHFGVFQKHTQSDNQQIAQDIPPGTNRATITLSDGTSIVLGEDRAGIATDGDMIRYDDGTEVVGLAEVQHATLTTPVAGQYQVQLPDGSRAWLNAASSITYPTRFTGDERAITVTGEVFLEVAKDAAKPFIVMAGEQHIEVLGTSFNIDAYGDSRQSVTTLTEGRLKVINTRSNATVLLNPGQQAIVSDKEDIDVRSVDTQSFTAWKDGAYFLKNQSLSRFGKQIERWYDVDVDMGRHGNIHLSAMISRDAKLSTVLQAIELKTGITFKVEGRRVTAIE